MLRMIAACLLLGNVSLDESTYVEGSNPCSLVIGQDMKDACELLQLDP